MTALHYILLQKRKGNDAKGGRKIGKNLLLFLSKTEALSQGDQGDHVRVDAPRDGHGNEEGEGHLDNLFMLVVFGDLVGLPLLPPYYSMRLLPHIIPSLEMWKRRLVREKDLPTLWPTTSEFRGHSYVSCSN